MDWVIRWAASLMPDPESVPGSEVFQDNTQQYSLTANAAGAPTLLFTSSDALLQNSNQIISQIHDQTHQQIYNHSVSLTKMQTQKQFIKRSNKQKSLRKRKKKRSRHKKARQHS